MEELGPRLTPSVTFAPQQTFADGTYATSVAAADFNGDGRPDLAVTNDFTYTVSVLLNTTPPGATAPAFAARTTFGAGYYPRSAVVGDFNGDGRPDLAVANGGGGNTVSVLLDTTAPGATVPSFAPLKSFAVGADAGSVAVGDFNGDGRPDLAVTVFSSLTWNGSVALLLDTTPAGSASVSFAALQTLAAGTDPAGVAVGDFNGDGRPDLAVANNGDTTVSVLLNTTPAGGSNSSFAAAQSYFVGYYPTSVAVGDFNGDGRPDLAAGNPKSDTVAVLLNSTAAGATTTSFTGLQTFAVGTQPNSVVAGDFDGDGRPDLAVANFGNYTSSGSTVSVLLNTTASGAAAPTFATQQTFAAVYELDGLEAADFNGDGRPDLAVANYGDVTVSVLSDTTASFPVATPVIVGQAGSQGLWAYSRAAGTWLPLVAANASLLVANAQGDVVGEFPGYGLWAFRLTVGWVPLNGIDATALAMDARGDVVASFPGFGVGEYLTAAGWRLLTGATATLLAMDDTGDIVGECPGWGLWLFRPAAGWKLLNGVDATLLAMNGAGAVAADFKGYGVGEYTAAGGWRTVDGRQTSALAIDRMGDVVACFKGAGVTWIPPAGASRLLVAADFATLLAVDACGDVYAEFPGFGVWEYDAYRGWVWLTAADATRLAVA